jgi:hypothetical protein
MKCYFFSIPPRFEESVERWRVETGELGRRAQES